MPLRLTGASFCPGVRSSHDSGYLAEISLTRSQRDDQPVAYHVDPPVASWELDELFAASWCRHEPRDWNPVMKRSLVYVCAYREERLVGFVNVAWDGASTVSCSTLQSIPRCSAAVSEGGWYCGQPQKREPGIWNGYTWTSSHTCGGSTIFAASDPRKQDYCACKVA